MFANTDSKVVAAFFRNYNSAEKAISELGRSGFKANQIGCSYDSTTQNDIEDVNVRANDSNASNSNREPRSFWDKVGGMFSGDEGYESRDADANDGTLNIPDRYQDRLSSGGCLVTVNESTRLVEAEQILARNGGEIDREFATNTATDPAYSTGAPSRDREVTGERRIRLMSEMLRVNKERISSGDVRLRKEVRTETQNLEVPVTHEELVIDRMPVEGRTATDAHIGSDEEIRVPLSEERVVVDKTPIVRQEVRVGIRAVQDTEHVTDEVRHEELKVDDQTKRGARDLKERKIA